MRANGAQTELSGEPHETTRRRVFFSRYVITSGIWDTWYDPRYGILNPITTHYMYTNRNHAKFIHDTLEEAELMAAQLVEMQKNRLQNQLKRLNKLTSYRIRKA